MQQHVRAEALHSLFVIVRGGVAEHKQREMVAGLDSVCRGQPDPYRYGFDKLGTLVVAEGHQLPAWLEGEAERLLGLARGASEAVPDTYEVAAVELLGYKEGSSLAPHVDYVAGWSIIVSLGCTALFYFRVGGSSAPLHRVRVESGDAILFPTFGDDHVWHGIECFEPDSAPSWFSFRDYCRLCVQFRSSYYHLH